MTGSSILVESDGREAAEFIDTWHGDSDELIQIIRMLPVIPKPRALTVPRGECVKTLRDHGLDELIYANGQIWNLYHSVGFVKSVPEGRGRGGKDNVLGVPGVFLDLDVNKSTSFRDHEQILEYVETLPLPPSILVNTGSGGVQAYWRCTRLLPPGEADLLCARWLEFAQRRTPQNVWIDKVFTSEHPMRLPGSIRWPKKDEAPSVSRIIHTADVTYEPEQLLSLTEEAWSDKVTRMQQTRRETNQMKLNSLDLAGENEWMRMYITSQLPEHFNETHSWEQVLSPLGWTQLGQDNDGRTLWARPGGDGSKSATTDWPESPNVMKLFSTSPETGLAHLDEAGVVLTKYRVYVQLHCNGDEVGFIQQYLTTMNTAETSSK